MSDIWLEWGGDLVLTNTGDLLVATNFDEIRQFVSRVLLTNPSITLPNGLWIPPDYNEEPTFGLGLPRSIGRTYTATQLQTMQNAALAACYDCPSVATIPAPRVVVANPSPFVYTLNIYVTPINSVSGEQVISIPLS